MTVRMARVTNYTSRKQVERYLPQNYVVLVETSEGIVIQGSDMAGWTLDGYVIPRLGSGLIGCKEITAKDIEGNELG